ncbi:hypothetical protein RQP46_008463 [Phenoliferia psychrophenolica]
MSLLEAAVVRLRVLANPSTTAIGLYLACAPASSILATVIGSTSEYRFPHPLLTTTLHLAISLSTLIALAFAASAFLDLASSRRQLSSRPIASPLHSALAALAALRPSARALSTERLAAALTPYILSASIAAVLASLVESRAARITEPSFWTLARLVPLAMTTLAAATPHAPRVLDDVAPTTVAIAACVWCVLMAGPAVAWGASSEGWMCGLVYAVCVFGWVLSVKAGMQEGEEVAEEGTTKPSPTIALYLALALALLLPPLLLSDELHLAYDSGHFGFFTEVGFWLQELVMAWCGLASLGAFWSLIRNVDPLTVFIIVGLKDAAVPYLYSSAFGNPLAPPIKPILKPNQQSLALFAIAVYYIVDLKLEKEEETAQKAK